MREIRSKIDIERDLEHVPALEEIFSVIKGFKGMENLEIGEIGNAGKFEDEKGVYLCDTKVPGGLEGEEIVFEYLRKGEHKEKLAEDGKSVIHKKCSSGGTTIHKVYYKDGEYIWGEPVAEYADGEWKEIK